MGTEKGLQMLHTFADITADRKIDALQKLDFAYVCYPLSYCFSIEAELSAMGFYMASIASFGVSTLMAQ